MADEFDPNNITDLSKVREERVLGEAYGDFQQDVAGGAELLAEKSAKHPWKYGIGDRVATEQSLRAGQLPFQITERMVRPEGLLEGSRPREGVFIKGPDVPYYKVVREDATTWIPEWAVKQKLGISGAVPDEPRPPEQSNLPAVLEAASAASQLLGPRDEPRPKGKLQGGIGALRKAPWFALARMAWNELSPDQRQVAEDYAKQAYGSLEAGIDAAQEWMGRQDFPEGFAGGLEWAKDALGFGDQEPSGIMSLPDLQKYRSLFHGGPYQWAPEPGYPEGRARLDKQGTGEGAAAYGWGFYAAEAPKVGKGYQESLTSTIPGAPSGSSKYRVTGVDFPEGRAGHMALDSAQDIESYLSFKMSGQSPDMENYLRGQIDRRMARWRDQIAATEKAGHGTGGIANQDMKALSDYWDIYARPAKSGDISEHRGALYQLDIPEADTDRLLDYDAPLSEQPKSIQDALAPVIDKLQENPAIRFGGAVPAQVRAKLQENPAILTGEDIQSLLTQIASYLPEGRPDTRGLGATAMSLIRSRATGELGVTLKEFGYQQPVKSLDEPGTDWDFNPNRAVSKFLNSLGIPGLKYLDQGSRSGANVDVIINGTSAKDLSSVEQMAAERVADAVYRLKSEGKPHGANESVKSAFTTIVNDIGLMGNFSDEAQALKSARSWEYIRLLEEWASDPGSVELKDTTTRNYVVWDQDLLDRLKTVRKEARGGFIDKPLYDQPRMIG